MVVIQDLHCRWEQRAHLLPNPGGTIADEAQAHSVLGNQPGRLHLVEGNGLIPEDQVRLCFIGNGAPWIWKQVRPLFPSAVEILDY